MGFFYPGATADSISVCWCVRTIHTQRKKPQHWLCCLQSLREEHMGYKGFGYEEEKEDGSMKA